MEDKQTTQDCSPIDLYFDMPSAECRAHAFQLPGAPFSRYIYVAQKLHNEPSSTEHFHSQRILENPAYCLASWSFRMYMDILKGSLKAWIPRPI